MLWVVVLWVVVLGGLSLMQMGHNHPRRRSWSFICTEPGFLKLLRIRNREILLVSLRSCHFPIILRTSASLQSNVRRLVNSRPSL